MKITGRKYQQLKVSDWAVKCFGPSEALSVPHRALRLLEEATEAAQAAGVPAEQCHLLIGHVFAKPPGELFQEMGGVGVTAMALCQAAGFYAEDAENTEIDRVLSKQIEHFRARNQAKNDAGLKADR